MTPAEGEQLIRFTGILIGFCLLGALLGLAVIIEIIRPRNQNNDVVAGYTISVTVATLIAVAYLLAGDTP